MGCKDSKPAVHEPIARGHGKVPSNSPEGSTQSTRPGSSLASSLTGGAHAGAGSATTSGGSLPSSQSGGRQILGRYTFAGRRGAVLGEGTSSICYLGRNIETGDSVAIKVYKQSRAGSVGTLTKFRRQVRVLLELQRPFERPAQSGLWSQELAGVEPSDLFVKLLDFSKDAKGEPGRDPVDGSMYVVTELADYTLKGMLRQRGQRAEPLSAEQARKIARDVMLAGAGLHAKGFVHMDIKPENIMMSKGRWKLIDMDGCVRAGTTLKLNDSSVSFSPCYCAPEFGRFVVKGGSLVVSPSLDVWSVGMTIGELVNLCPLLREQYQEVSAGYSGQAGSTRFLKWLGNVAAAPLPQRAWTGEHDFTDLLSMWLLVPDQAHRRTLAEGLSAPYFAPCECDGPDPQVATSPDDLAAATA